MTSPLPCQRCRHPADPTLTVYRGDGKEEPNYYCRDCWAAFFNRVLTAAELEREERARRMIEAEPEGGRGR